MYSLYVILYDAISIVLYITQLPISGDFIYLSIVILIYYNSFIFYHIILNLVIICAYIVRNLSSMCQKRFKKDSVFTGSLNYFWGWIISC